MYDKDGTEIGAVAVYFSSTMNYHIASCTSDWTKMPVQPPEQVEKVWTFTKTETALTISCNDVEVLNYQFADSSESNCVAKLGGDVVEQIKFPSWDTASDFYSIGKGIRCPTMQKRNFCLEPCCGKTVIDMNHTIF